MTPLHQFGNFVKENMALIPLSLVKGLFIAIPLLILVWVLFLPASETTPNEDRPLKWDENLKYGASAALIFQILIYFFFA